MGELGTNGTRRTVSASDLSPDDLQSGRGTERVGNTLAEVKLGGLLCVDILELQEGGVVVLVTQGSGWENEMMG